MHTHLLKNLLNIREDTGSPTSAAQRSETSPDDPRKVRERPSNSFGHVGKKSSTNVFGDEPEDLTKVLPDTSSSAISKMLNLSKKDTQGVVPLCLLVMNMTPLERNKACFDIPELRGSLSPKAGDKDLAKTAANFFSQDHNQEKTKSLNKRRKQLMRLLLEVKDE